MAISQNDISIINQMINQKLKDLLPQISQQIFANQMEDVIDGIETVFKKMIENPDVIDRIIERMKERS